MNIKKKTMTIFLRGIGGCLKLSILTSQNEQLIMFRQQLQQNNIIYCSVLRANKQRRES